MCIDKVCLEWRLYTGGKGSLRLRRKMADRSPQGNAHFGPRRDTPTGAVWVWRSASGSGHRHGSAVRRGALNADSLLQGPSPNG
jgi:hypothetical protein